MFIVLRTVKLSNRYFSRKKQRKMLEKNEPISVPTENGLPFFVLDVPEEKNGADHEFIEKKCGRYVSRIIAPRTVLLPDSSRLKRFVSAGTKGRFLFNTAEETIRNSALPPSDISITLIDRSAFLSYEIKKLLPLASSVRVVTSRPEKYAAVCNEIYNEFGASVTVRPSYEPSSKKDIIICCDGATNRLMENSAVFSLKRGIYGNPRFYAEKIELSDKHKEIIPPDIDSSDFSSAVTELCGSTEYKQAVFTCIETSCDFCDENNASKCLDCYISESAVSN